MGDLKTAEAVELGREIGRFLERGQTARAFDVVAPLLQRRIHFAMLDRVAREFGQVALDNQDAFLEMLAQSETIGSWPLIGSALAGQLETDLRGALARERKLAVIGNVWYAADALGERTAGPGLVMYFDATCKHLVTWRDDENRWVRRSIGVGVHVWAKQTKGREPDKAGQLLDLLEPLWGEQEMDAIKGVGWGLKTIGRYYPELMQEWLRVQEGRPHRALILKKARTYL